MFDIMHANDCRQKGYEISRDNKNHIRWQDLFHLRGMFELKQFNKFKSMKLTVTGKGIIIKLRSR